MNVSTCPTWVFSIDSFRLNNDYNTYTHASIVTYGTENKYNIIMNFKLDRVKLSFVASAERDSATVLAEKVHNGF